MFETFDSKTGFVFGVHRFQWLAALHARLIGGGADSAAFGEGHPAEWSLDV